MRTLLIDDLRGLLRSAVNGNAKVWCAEHDISESYVSAVLRGRADPGDKLLAALKLEKIVTYRKVQSCPE